MRWFAEPNTSKNSRPGGGAMGSGVLGEGDQWLLGALLGVAVLGLLVLAVGHLSALVFDGGWPRYRLADAPGVLARVVGQPGDPGRAWDPVNRGAAPPGPVAWWGTAVVLVSLSGFVALRVRGLANRTAKTGTTWAEGRELRRLRVRRRGAGRLVVGTSGRRLVAVESHHSLLALGPTRSGKTSGLAVPSILEWPGVVVATSTKADLVEDTIGWRSRQGRVWVFDPAGCTPYEGAGWSPLASCGTWAGSVRAAHELSKAGKAAVGGTMSLADFWFGSAAKSLAPYLFAAALSGADMGYVARWVDGEAHKEVTALLRGAEEDAALAHEATFRREDRARSSLFQVMQQVVGAYLDPGVAASSARSDITAAELFDGRANTLYITAPHHEQDRLRPVFATLLDQVVRAAYELAALTGTPLDPAVLLVLDEAANIAPVEDLPTIASTAAAHGLQLVTVFQDLAQIRLRYGEAAGTVVNNHRAKLLLPGISDLDTLDLASRLAGEEEVVRDSVTTDAGGRRSATTGTQWRRLLPPEAVCRLADGEGVLLYGNLPPAKLRLRPWFADRTLRRRARCEAPRTAAPGSSPLGPDDDEPPAPLRPARPPDPPPDAPAAMTVLDAARARRRARAGKA